MKVAFVFVLGVCAFAEVSAQCSTSATTIPKNKRKKVKTQNNKWHTACLAVDPPNTCVWNFKRKKCVPFPGCDSLMRGTCDEVSTCHWKPNQQRRNWKYRNWISRRTGKCVTNPPGYNPELCEYKYKTQCQKASQCRFNNPPLANSPGGRKCSLKPGHSEKITSNAPTPAPTNPTSAPTLPTDAPTTAAPTTSAPTFPCNPNTCDGLVCADSDSTCQAAGNWNSCGGDWSNRKYCPEGWARCNDGKCISGSDTGCGAFGGLDISFQAC